MCQDGPRGPLLGDWALCFFSFVACLNSVCPPPLLPSLPHASSLGGKANEHNLFW